MRFINSFIEQSVRRIFKSGYPFRLIYRTNIPRLGHEGSIESIRIAFMEELEKKVDNEIRVSQCLIGPHRDDLLCTDEKLDVRSFGSVGEARLSSIILKCAQATFYRETKSVSPILLIDDILLELDRRNMEKVLALISEESQKVITTTEMVKLPEIFSYDEVFRIEEKGRLL